MKILVTGVAGFIGAFATKQLLTNPNNTVVGLDNLNNYYDVSLKQERLEMIQHKNFSFIKGDISDKEMLVKLFNEYHFDKVLHLAAQAGVRYSITNPDIYIQTNIVGFFNILECCKMFGAKHLVFASSSSVYGDNTKIPYSIEDKTDQPVSLYAATKKADELLAYSYAKLYKIPITGLRFFTVYGPMGRPDMAYYSFSKKLIKGRNIELFNFGKCKRDFTYIDDVVDGIIKALDKVPSKSNLCCSSAVPFCIYNLGNNSPVELFEFVKILVNELKKCHLLEENFNVNNHIVFLPLQLGDVIETSADTNITKKDLVWQPSVNLNEGIKRFVEWMAKRK